MVEIGEIRSPSELRQFVAFPETLYRTHPSYLPKRFDAEMATLNREKNSSFEYCEGRHWLARKGSAPVGRMAGIISQRHIETWKSKRACSGWLDLVDYRRSRAECMGWTMV
jgi:hypothetical protein